MERTRHGGSALAQQASAMPRIREPADDGRSPLHGFTIALADRRAPTTLPRTGTGDEDPGTADRRSPAWVCQEAEGSFAPQCATARPNHGPKPTDVKTLRQNIRRSRQAASWIQSPRFPVLDRRAWSPGPSSNVRLRSRQAHHAPAVRTTALQVCEARREDNPRSAAEASPRRVEASRPPGSSDPHLLTVPLHHLGKPSGVPHPQPPVTLSKLSMVEDSVPHVG